jgi:tetratricopeptide (TPR) repeat protein
MYEAGVACSDCHTDHASFARREAAADACARCHVPQRYAVQAHTRHPPGPGSRCVDCHMPTRSYMVVHARRDHSIRIPRPDLTLAIGTPNACNGCHADRDAAWAAAAVERWWGPGVAARPHFGTAIHAARRGAPGASRALAGLILDPRQPSIVRATAASLFPRAPGPEALNALAAAASDPDPLVRRGAIEGADALPPAERLGLLLARLEDSRRSVRIEAAARLAGQRGLTPIDAARLERALREARGCADLVADQPDGLTQIGNLARATGDAAGAERAYREVLRRTPAYPHAAVNLADLLREQARDPEGLAVLDAALAAAPSSDGLHLARGLALVRLGRRDEAGPALAQAFALAPGRAVAALALAAWHEARGEAGRVREVLLRALEHSPYEPELLASAGAAAWAAGDREAARSHFGRLVDVRPFDPRARAAFEEAGGRRDSR